MAKDKKILNRYIIPYMATYSILAPLWFVKSIYNWWSCEEKLNGDKFMKERKGNQNIYNSVLITVFYF